jgi:ATP dependent DNA ligase domain
LGGPVSRPEQCELGLFRSRIALTLHCGQGNYVSLEARPDNPHTAPRTFRTRSLGSRTQARRIPGLGDTINGRLLSKNLNRLQRYERLLDSLPLDCVFDGEICALDQDGKPDFKALLFRRSQPVFIAFDLLFYEAKDIRLLPLKERRNILDQVAKRYGMQKSELFVGCAKKLFATVCEMNLEGIVLKKLDAHYDPGRTKWWKVPNAGYSQKEGRGELFEKRAG